MTDTATKPLPKVETRDKLPALRHQRHKLRSSSFYDAVGPKQQEKEGAIAILDIDRAAIIE